MRRLVSAATTNVPGKRPDQIALRHESVESGSPRRMVGHGDDAALGELLRDRRLHTRDSGHFWEPSSLVHTSDDSLSPCGQSCSGRIRQHVLPRRGITRARFACWRNPPAVVLDLLPWGHGHHVHLHRHGVLSPPRQDLDVETALPTGLAKITKRFSGSHRGTLAGDVRLGVRPDPRRHVRGPGVVRRPRRRAARARSPSRTPRPPVRTVGARTPGSASSPAPAPAS